MFENMHELAFTVLLKLHSIGIIDWQIDWLPKWLNSVSRSTDNIWLKAPTLNHMVVLSTVASKNPKQRHSY